jgi:hypothetical protein
VTPRAEREFDGQAAGVIWGFVVVVLVLAALVMAWVASW